MLAQEINMIEWKERLNHAIESTGTKKTSLAELLNTRRSTITGYTSGPSTTIDATALVKLCQYMGVDPLWVITGQGSMRLDDGKLRPAPHIGGAGEPLFATKNPNVITVELTGEKSFEPRINEGDILFVDRCQQSLESPNLYCCKDKDTGKVFIRRYFHDFLRRKIGLLDGLADEARKETLELMEKDEFEQLRKHFDVIGRVVGVYSNRI